MKPDMEQPIFVTQPTLPSLEEFRVSLERIWENKWLTNNGEFHQQFEKNLAEYLRVPYISLFSNGTLGLLTAYQVLGLTGEVITTPYSFVATAHTLLWNKLTPVFCDVDPVYGNLDPDKIEDLITSKTSAIVPVHVYGNPCEVEKIATIANKHKLKIVYDAAHAFGVTKNGESILNFGDLSVLSFHATKTFNTIEGGAIICKNAETKKQIDFLKNFGFSDEVSVVAAGINAKMNEVQAAFGLLQLQTITQDIAKRKKVAEAYREGLRNIVGIRWLEDMDNIYHNYSYFPIYVEKEFVLTRDELYHRLKENNIFGRRYFYPLISDFPMYKGLESAQSGKLPSATKHASEVICLPIYVDLGFESIEQIINLIKSC